MFSRLALRHTSRVGSMSARWSSSLKDGSVAQQKAFKERETAAESEYAHKQEQAYLKKLRADIDLKKAELAKLEKEHETAAQKE
ncbi:hypothetical protein D9757_003236 [Collybiopsis confluens]|uniref:ATPase inhibitor n=1 Tax=Collybiopsis confluens TaxID=2823264 RepID=A0A8H5HYL8_9AGAR|nr:hypothetical protein D9757_003236 [Collybiopsis confluens]